MPEKRFGVGLIVPSSNTVMEPDFHCALGDGAAVSTARMFLETVTREAEIVMVRNELPRALRLIRTVAPGVVVFGCTSAGSLEELQDDVSLAGAITEVTQTPVVTVMGAVVQQLERIRPQRIAVFTPYIEDLTESVADCIREAGFNVAQTAGMGIVGNREIGCVTPGEIVAFVKERIQDADCLFLSCTNWRAMEAVAALKHELNIPVLTSNAACVEAVRALAG